MEYILLMALFWTIAASGPRLLNFDGDLPRHLLVGRLIRETREVPLTDTFSYRSVGFASIPHEWLSQVIFSISNDLLGLSGAVLLAALIVTATWALVIYETNRRTGSLIAVLLASALGIAASMIHILPRPHLFTYLFTALWIIVLERVVSDKPKFWWLLPVLMLLWVNLHGMFVLGIIILGIYLVGSLLENPDRKWFTSPATKSLLLAGLFSVFATFCSPSGIQIWDAILSLGSNTYITSRIPEYQSADFHMPETWPFLLLLLITIAAFARSTRKTPWTSILLTLAFAGIAIYTSRMIPLFGIVVVPVSAKAIGDLFGQELSSSQLAKTGKNINAINSSSNGFVWIVILLIGVIFLIRSRTAIDPEGKGNVFDGGFFPVQAVDWLNQNPPSGRMFNEFDWGGYLLLRLNPRQQIFMDGHTHIYGETLTREYETVISLADGWQEVLDSYQVEWAILRTDSRLARALENRNWKIIYQDDTTTVLTR